MAKCKLPRKDRGVPFTSKDKAANFLKNCIIKRGYNGRIVKSGIRYKGSAPTYFVYKTKKIS